MKALAYFAALIAGILTLFAAAVGYLANVVFLVKAVSLVATGQIVVSAIGIFLAPVGILHGLGWLVGWW